MKLRNSNRRSRSFSDLDSHSSFGRWDENFRIQNHQYITAVSNSCHSHLRILYVFTMRCPLNPLICEQIHDEFVSVHISKGKSFADLAVRGSVHFDAIVGH